jgi:hypothetical protein
MRLALSSSTAGGSRSSFAVQRQARTRDNVPATNEELERLRQLLGIHSDREADGSADMNDGPTYLETMRIVLPVLRQLGVDFVQVDFDGSGDSGQIERAQLAPNVDTSGVRVDVPVTHNQFLDGRWQGVTVVKSLNLDDAIQQLSEGYIESNDCDWFNNDGGWGSMTIDVGSGSVSIEINVRYTESTCEVSKTLDIDSGEEIDA